MGERNSAKHPEATGDEAGQDLLKVSGANEDAAVGALPIVTSTPTVPEDPLPSGWVGHTDPASGNQFYHNASTGQTQWERPVEPASAVGSASAQPPVAEQTTTGQP